MAPMATVPMAAQKASTPFFQPVSERIIGVFLEVTWGYPITSSTGPGMACLLRCLDSESNGVEVCLYGGC